MKYRHSFRAIAQFLKQTFSLSPDYTHRIFGLDLMRSIAIINVVLAHAGWAYAYIGNIPIKRIPGSDMFFVLSGFLVGHTLLKQFLSDESFSMKRITQFWTRSSFRTLPNYYFVLLLNILFCIFGIIHEDITQFSWKFLFFLQNFNTHFQGFFWESWSLSIVEWFYFISPFFLALFYCIGRRLNISKRAIFLLMVISFEAVTLLLRIFVASKFDVDAYGYDVRIRKVVVYHFDGIALGLLCAYLKQYHPNFWFRSRNITFILGIALSYIALYIEWDINSPVTKILKILLHSMGCALLLPRFDTIKKAPMWLSKPVTHLSLISYSIYLINLSLVASVIVANANIVNVRQAWIWFVVYWIVVIIASTLLYKYYEKPITDLRKKL